jgi:hypothetical protein
LGHAPTRAEQIAGEDEWAIGENYPVAILDSDLRRLFGVETQTVLLSDSSMFKQVFSRSGQDFGLRDYWKVQAVIEQAQVIVRTANQESLAFIHAGDEWWQAVIKATQDRREVYLQSFRKTNAANLAAVMKNGEVLRDAR